MDMIRLLLTMGEGYIRLKIKFLPRRPIHLGGWAKQELDAA